MCVFVYVCTCVRVERFLYEKKNSDSYLFKALTVLILKIMEISFIFDQTRLLMVLYVNQTCQSINGGSLEILFAVPLTLS